MSSINFQRTYYLGDSYDEIIKRASHKLEKYWNNPNVFAFSAEERSLTFTSERIIPANTQKRPRVMLLFSNPHPHSIAQGMFLSRNTHGQESLFWPVMKTSGWLSLPKKTESPIQLADRCIRADYDGPFDLVFYCYYAFPTDYPEDIRGIFGREYFRKFIEPGARAEFFETLRNIDIEAIVTFNKGIFNHVSQHQVDRYINRLKAGELVHSQVISGDQRTAIFLTYPTGWRYHRDYLNLRVSNLDKIKETIIEQVESDACENT